MKLAIMQPYFLPYLGYFQLLAAAERFVVLDNVSFRKSSYIHRNRVWLGRHVGWLSLPVDDASSYRRIGDHRVTLNERHRSRLLRMVAHGYARAPFRDEGLAVLERSLPLGNADLAETLSRGLAAGAAALGLPFAVCRASELDLPAELRGEARVLAICRQLQARDYLNLPGGRALYDARTFAAEGLRLGFIVPRLDPYPQGRAAFTPSLSVLDLIMHVAPAERRRHVEDANIEWAATTETEPA